MVLVMLVQILISGWPIFIVNNYSFIFLISINFVEYKTIKTKHPYLKIILFSFIFWLIFTLFLSLFYGFVFKGIQGEAVVGVIYLLLYTPMVTGIIFLVSSLIPSLVFYKIKDNKKIQNILLYGGIILAILIFILALVGRWMYERTDWTVR